MSIDGHRLCFHIGWPKTGSTSIQRFVSQNRDALEEIGFYYPLNLVEPSNLGDSRNLAVRNRVRGASHGVIYREITPDANGLPRQRQGVSEQLFDGAFVNAINAFERSGCHTLVLSNENVFWHSREIDGRRLPQCLANYSVELVVYFRRYDDYYLSQFKQRVKTGKLKVRHFSKFVEQRLQAPRPLFHIERLLELFGGRVIIKSYHTVGRQIVPDFLRTIGVPGHFLSQMKDSISTHGNPSFSDLLALFVLDFDRRGVPADLAEDVHAELRRLNITGELPGDLPKLTLISAQMRRDLLNQYNADVRALNDVGLANVPEVDHGAIVDTEELSSSQIADIEWNSVLRVLPSDLSRRLRELDARDI